MKTGSKEFHKFPVLSLFIWMRTTKWDLYYHRQNCAADNDDADDAKRINHKRTLIRHSTPSSSFGSFQWNVGYLLPRNTFQSLTAVEWIILPNDSYLLRWDRLNEKILTQLRRIISISSHLSIKVFEQARKRVEIKWQVRRLHADSTLSSLTQLTIHICLWLC